MDLFCGGCWVAPHLVCVALHHPLLAVLDQRVVEPLDEVGEGALLVQRDLELAVDARLDSGPVKLTIPLGSVRVACGCGFESGRVSVG